MSERTAHRIVSGQIRPLRSVAARLTRSAAPRGDAPREREVDLARDRRGLRVAPADVEEFSRVMERDFSLLADRYYLSLAGEPRVRVSGQRVTVTFDLAPSD